MTIKRFAYFLIVLGFTLAIWFLIAGDYIHWSILPDTNKAKEIQPFMTGLVAPVFSLAGVLLVFENLRNQTRQQISNIFFSMINLHHKIAEDIRDNVEGISELERESVGRVFFDDLAFRIYIDYYGKNVEWRNECGETKTYVVIVDESFTDKSSKDRLKAVYFYYFHLHHSSLGHYFRNLFHIVKYIDQSKCTKVEKINYVKILRAQLSNYEILLLAYNALTPYGKDFKPLIEKYKLLKNLNFEDNLSDRYIKRIVDPEIWISEYPHLNESLKDYRSLAS